MRASNREILFTMFKIAKNHPELFDGNVTPGDIKRYVKTAFKAIETRSAREKWEYDRRKERMEAAGDPLKDLVFTYLTKDFQTSYEILFQMDMKGLTPSRLVKKLTKLCEEGLAQKAPLKFGKNRKLMGYALMNPPHDEEGEDDEFSILDDII